jgi:DNA-binding transcriptional LysR family regulator
VGIRPLATPWTAKKPAIGLTWRTDRALAPAAARFVEFLRLAGPFV